MATSTMSRKLPRKLLIALLWLCIWGGAAAAVGQTLLLPSPASTLHALLAMAGQASFWWAALASMLRIVAGFLLGIALGASLAVLTSRSAWWRDFFAPLLSAIKATPVASFIVLALVWIRTDGVPVFATVLVVLPVVWANVSSGIAATSPELLEMARAFSLPWHGMLRRIYWPSIRPYFQAAVTTGMGMAWKAGVAAEVIATPRMSLGSHLYEAKIYLNTPELFASTGVVILLSILLEALVKRAVSGGKRRRVHA